MRDQIFWPFFKVFLLIYEFYFGLISPPKINVLKYALNHFLVYSRAKHSLRSAKNKVFFLLCILADSPMARAIAPPHGYATAYIFFAKHLCF